MSEPDPIQAAILETLRSIDDTLRELRTDLKRREQRHLEDAGKIPRTSSSSAGPCFPNYGRRKGEPIAGASEQDLDYYAAGCRRTLADPSKSRWHEKERATLAAIEAELQKHGGAAPAPDFGSAGGDSDIPF